MKQMKNSITRTHQALRCFILLMALIGFNTRANATFSVSKSTLSIISMLAVYFNSVNALPCSETSGFSLVAFGTCQSKFGGLVTLRVEQSEHIQGCSKIISQFENQEPETTTLPTAPNSWHPITMACFPEGGYIAIIPAASTRRTWIEDHGTYIPDYSINITSDHHVMIRGPRNTTYITQFENTDDSNFMPDLTTIPGTSLGVATWQRGTSVQFKLLSENGDSHTNTIADADAIGSSGELHIQPSSVCVNHQCMIFYTATRNRSEQLGIKAQMTIQDGEEFLESSPQTEINWSETERKFNMANPRALFVSQQGNTFRVFVSYQPALEGDLFAKIVDWDGTQIIPREAVQITNKVANYGVSNLEQGKQGVWKGLIASSSYGYKDKIIQKFTIFPNGKIRVLSQEMRSPQRSGFYFSALLSNREDLSEVTSVSQADLRTPEDLGSPLQVEKHQFPKKTNRN